ncbi:hypothetical protein BD324DRAFT_651555 [Kockovaella imperatae]|uniref:Translation initiation factor eIF2B subunit alpha n=1 Tax=Kockovaella imperatae TaxID=4999 RepID=A0A1Y1UGW1_9TREE|nr:hypothetical protein BD324DRAFT_651555 [Kockovaella imperatae]ORX36315.1 hypothetical protein BD324DRAFT_651555 [Kockovaella imperatae]
MSVATARPPIAGAGSSTSVHHRAGPSRKTGPPAGFEVLSVYQAALAADLPAPIAAIMTLVSLMEASSSTTMTGLASEVNAGTEILQDNQANLGVRAGCQLWERFFASSGGGPEDFATVKKSLINQGKQFCHVTAPACREKIATLAADFLVDGCTVLTHGFSRTVILTLLKAHKQSKRFNVYITEGRPSGMGMRTHNVLTKAGIPCVVVLDSAVSYVMDRCSMVLVGAEAVVESGGIVSYIGTYQLALVARAMQKPFYALAESYKFLRHYPLSQTDIPRPKHTGIPLLFTHDILRTPSKPDSAMDEAKSRVSKDVRVEMTEGMEEQNPLVDVTAPELIDFIFTDLGAPLSPTSVSQYLVAQFAS